MKKPSKPRPFVVKGIILAEVEYVWPKRMHMVKVKDSEFRPSFMNDFADWVKRANRYVQYERSKPKETFINPY